MPGKTVEMSVEEGRTDTEDGETSCSLSPVLHYSFILFMCASIHMHE